MNIAIVTQPDDIHAAAVCYGLKRLGHNVSMLYPSDFPQLTAAAIEIDGIAGKLEARVANSTVCTNFTNVDVVWLRRLVKPVLATSLHEADKMFAERECGTFMDGLISMFPDEAFWVNPWAARIRANNKVVQLKAAAQAKVKIPVSLITNDPREVMSFFYQRNKSIVFKPFRFATWKHGRNSASLFTTEITEEHLQKINQIALCPGIFQEKITKSSEIRVNVMGREVHAIQIFTQENTESMVDSRVLQGSPKNKEIPYNCDDDLKRICFAIMDALGICFGALDFIVSPDGEYIFLEVNEMGQFLWLEESAPSIPVLDTFVKFLISRDKHFVRSSPVVDTSLQDFFSSSDYRNHCELVNDLKHGLHHINPPVTGLYTE